MISIVDELAGLNMMEILPRRDKKKIQPKEFWKMFFKKV